jgi:glycosyltransferase involved in cell wall biosynthesis
MTLRSEHIKARVYMNSPLITCIIPVFNGERYLRETLDSVFAQTYRPLDVVLVDDGSTDKTAAIAATYDDRVRYIHQNNQGPAAARNQGIRAARGEFIAFLDADDLWHPEKLERQIACFQIRPELEYCVTYCQNFWAPELQAEAERYRTHRISRPMPGFVTGTLIARRGMFELVGLFNSELAHGDSTQWFLRAAEHGAVMELLPDALTYRRLHSENRSRLLASSSREEFLHIVKMSLDSRRMNKPAD